jgi:hypothetical protein
MGPLKTNSTLGRASQQTVHASAASEGRHAYGLERPQRCMSIVHILQCAVGWDAHADLTRPSCIHPEMQLQ